MKTFDLEERVEKAKKLFKEDGFNCCQAVVLAYNDIFGLDDKTAASVASGFGGGMGRMREVCGSVSGMVLLAGLLKPATDPSDKAARTGNYALVQEVAADFKALNGWLDLAVKADYRRAKRNNNEPNFAQAVRNNPTRSAYDPNSTTGYNVWINETLEYNTVANVMLYDYYGLDQWLKPEVSAKLNILPVQGLTYTQTMGYELRQWENQTYRWSTHQDEVSVNRNGTAYQGFSKTENINSEGYFNYMNSFEKHNINATLGYSYYEYNNQNFEMTNRDFAVEGTAIWDIGTGGDLAKGAADMASSKAITQKLMAYFARVNYDYDGKYILSASFRRESSSKFAKNNRWGNFWSVSAGWRISDEPWMENASWIDDLKIRAAYGVTGNSDFSASYASMSYGSDGYFMMPTGNYAVVYGPAITLNPSLKWEEQHGWNFGLDFSLFDNRLYGKFDWYNRKGAIRTKDPDRYARIMKRYQRDLKYYKANINRLREEMLQRQAQLEAEVEALYPIPRRVRRESME